MLRLLLAVLLLAVPLTLEAATDEEDDGEEAVTTHHRVGANYMIPDRTPALGSIWVDFGYSVVDNFFDADGEFTALTVPLAPGLAADAEVQALTLHIGGSYNAFQLDNVNIALGVDLGFAQRTISTQAVPEAQVPATETSSGFAPRHLQLFAEGGTEAIALRAGFILDVGVEEDEDVIPNTDQQNALLLGLSGQHRMEGVRLFGGISYFYTLEGEMEGVSFDQGNIFNVNAGAAALLGPVEVGASLIYRLSTEGNIGGETVPTTPGPPNPFGQTQVFSVAPFVSFTPDAQPVTIFLKGAVQREYVDYAFALFGENDFAPRLGGFTIGAHYNF